MYGVKVMTKTRNILSKIFVVAIAACALYTVDSYAATKTAKSKTKTTTSSTKTVVVDNKTSQFNEVFTDLGAKTADTTSADLADRVRRQRALLDNKGNATSDGGKSSSGVTGANACDASLRKCMAEKCGTDFTKCSKDSTTIWGEKMDSCRRKTQCSGHEYSLLAPEILADRDFNERMAYYNSVISCGNRYNACMFSECGTTLDKCLSKSDGDRAISKCETIAKECKEQDSGMASRIMTVFGDLRNTARAQAEKDEKRLYELRDLMRTQCNRLGAMFDERTLDCVYTVNFFAGDNTTTPTSSKKLYAGDSFQCNANWFGVDVTTFKENAYRRTRAQTSASSAMLGAGVGVAAGLVASGAIDRALETQKAEKAAKEECENSGGEWKKGECIGADPEKACTNAGGIWENDTCIQKTNTTDGTGGQPNPEQECANAGRVYKNGACTQECVDSNQTYDVKTDSCTDTETAEEPTVDCKPICKTIVDNLKSALESGDNLHQEALTEPSCRAKCTEEIGTLCTMLEGKDLEDGKKINNPQLIFNNGKFYCDYKTDDGRYSFQTAQLDNTIANAIKCNMYNNNKDGCDKLKDKCEWKDDKCQDKPTEEQNSDERHASTQNPQDETAQVNIDLKVLTSANTPAQGYLRCKYKNKEAKTTKEGVLSLKKIPGNAECTITTSVPTCSSMKKTAKEFSAMQSVTMSCKAVDDCLAKSGKWDNNQCTGGDELVNLRLDIKGPSTNTNLKNLDITCGAGKKPQKTYPNEVIIYYVPASTRCTIKADYCDSYNETAATLNKMQKNKQPINLKCSDITLTWSDVLSKVKDVTMNKVECDKQTLVGNSSPAIKVPADAECQIHYTTQDGKKYTMRGITPYWIKTEEGFVIDGSKKKKNSDVNSKPLSNTQNDATERRASAGSVSQNATGAPTSQSSSINANQCDIICKKLSNALSQTSPIQVLPAAQKSCHNTCKPMMETKCGSFVTTSNEVTFKPEHVGNDIQYKCDIKTVKAKSGTKVVVPATTTKNDKSNSDAMAQNPQCKAVCDDLDLTPEKIYRTRQILSDASCQDACKPKLQEACTNLTKLNKPLPFGNDKIRITQAWARFNRNVNGKFEYYCEFTSTTWK